MREIKFRAWDKRQKRMIPPYLLCNLTGDMEQENEYIIFMEYTGLKDRNGKEVYEGDIVRAFKETDYRIKRWEEYYFIVKWDECGYWKFMRIDMKDWCHAGYLSDLNYIEIIGNIYENQELLK